MDDYINESAETQEVAEPELDVEESVETQEVAEPEEAEPTTEFYEEDEDDADLGSGRTEQDAAFARMRRENQQMMQALQRYFEGDTAEDLSINAMAYADQRDPDEYRKDWERDQEYETLKEENERLNEELLNARVERLMRDDLKAVQAIDPSIKSLDDLDESFVKYRTAGLSASEAYWALKSHEQSSKVKAPPAIGRVADTKVERDYFTSEEIDALTDEQLNDDKVWEKVMRSLERL